MMNKKQGFTLIELLVVVLIIGILAAMAMPAYFKAVERARMTEAQGLLGNIAQAQQRRYMKMNSYAKLYSGLDVSPTSETAPTFCTKLKSGKHPTTAVTAPASATDACGNGFAITLDQTNTGTSAFATGTATAYRVNSSQYKYSLSRPYQSTDVTCTVLDNSEQTKALCADFCGWDQLTGTSCVYGSTETTTTGD